MEPSHDTADAVPGPLPALEMWGGPECSYVRVGDRYNDQFALSGHDMRLDDLDRFAALGVRKLRYPISWERMVSGRIDWRWAEMRLERLRALGVQPIIGFVHHGGGPDPAGLLSPEFAPGLADFAAQVATRFPWVDSYTPINEPLTTARFSGLYGFWHPHGHDLPCFARCLMHQIEGIRLAMEAIRRINPGAQLVQTEDIGKTHGAPRLDYQADFENERRWLSFDLLCGRVDDRHPLRSHLQNGGITAAELDRLCESPCPPSILGMNHYVTSERFLDERLHLYPEESHVGNGRNAYVDVPALRVRLEGAVGPIGLLRELWERYHLPIAVTEVQLACGREDQLRWLVEVWWAAEQVRREGVDVRAVTAWALVGAYEWNSLLRDNCGHYESGAFDLRGPMPRPTALARAIKALATEGKFSHPVLAVPGWWRRPGRLTQPPVSAPRTGVGTGLLHELSFVAAAPILIVGANSIVGQAFVRGAEIRGLPFQTSAPDEADLTQPSAVRLLLDRHSPWAVINCGGYGDVDAAEADAAKCHSENTSVPMVLSEACLERGIKLLTFSSALVFDGAIARLYSESDTPHPLNVYGSTQFVAERCIAAAGRGALIVRTGVLFGPDDCSTFMTRTLRDLARGGRVLASMKHTISLTYVPELVETALDLLIDDESGIWHLVNSGAVTWYAWARAIAAMAGVPSEQVGAASPEALGWIAPRPLYSGLSSERGQLLTPWQRASECCFELTGFRRSGMAA